MALNRSKTLKRTLNSVQGRLIINSDKILDLMSQIREEKKTCRLFWVRHLTQNNQHIIVYFSITNL